jgi:hypothetical protein
VGAVVYACHPKLSESLRSEGLWFQASLGNKQTNKKDNYKIKPHFNGKKLGVMAHACHPKYSGKYRLRGARSGWPGQKVRKYV